MGFERNIGGETEGWVSRLGVSWNYYCVCVGVLEEICFRLLFFFNCVNSFLFPD